MRTRTSWSIASSITARKSRTPLGASWRTITASGSRPTCVNFLEKWCVVLFLALVVVVVVGVVVGVVVVVVVVVVGVVVVVVVGVVVVVVVVVVGVVVGVVVVLCSFTFLICIQCSSKSFVPFPFFFVSYLVISNCFVAHADHPNAKLAGVRKALFYLKLFAGTVLFLLLVFTGTHMRNEIGHS